MATYAARSRWDIKDLRHACLTFFDPAKNDAEKAETFRNLGRSFSAVHTIAYQIKALAEGRGSYSGWTVHQARYCLGLQETPFAPRPVREEPAPAPQEEEQAVAGDVSEPETLQRVMALVKFELGKQSSELLLEQASTLEEIRELLRQIAGSLETQTQLLSELSGPLSVRPNGAVDLPTNGFRRHRS